jgi:uncharacterized membrane protein
MGQSPPMRRSNKAPKKLGMAPQRILGICLIVVGIVILAIGMAIQKTPDATAGSGSTSFSLSNSWYILGGIGITLFGFILAVLGLRSRAARH